MEILFYKNDRGKEMKLQRFEKANKDHLSS